MPLWFSVLLIAEVVVATTAAAWALAARRRAEASAADRVRRLRATLDNARARKARVEAMLAEYRKQLETLHAVNERQNAARAGVRP